MDYRVDFEYTVPEYGEMFIEASSEAEAQTILETRFKEDEFFEGAKGLTINKVTAFVE